MRDIHIVTGQTATGKTSFALSKASETENIALISADARQIYKKLDIVTGKDIPESSNFVSVETNFELDSNRKAEIGYFDVKGAKLWGLDFVNPDIQFSSYDYCKIINHIIDRYIPADMTPWIIGGSYLYIKHLAYGFDTQAEPDWEQRENLSKNTVEELQNTLKDLDNEMFEELNNSDRNNPHRLMRKIEIVQQTSKPGSESKKNEKRYNIASMTGMVFKSKDKLREVITQRVLKRLDQGAIEETENILSEGFTANDPGLQTLGYSQLISHLAGEISKEEAIERWITGEMQYAKRQYTFMKQNNDIIWKEV